MTAIPITAIRTDGGTQPRAVMDFTIVEEYANAMADGALFPPLVVFYDGTDHWLADGFHRRSAADTLGLAEVECDVHQGTVRDAVLYSVSANASHGMRRTNDDKRRAVLKILNDTEWGQWSDREIARRCGVNHEMVGKLRPAPVVSGGNRQMEPPRFASRGGTTYTMNTSRIGSNPPSRPQADRPLFDSTAAGQREPAWTPADIRPEPKPEPRPITNDTSNDHLWHAIRDVAEIVGDLPSPDAVAAMLPIRLAYDLKSDDMRTLSRWLGVFADAWEPREQEGRAWTEMLLKGVKSNVAAE